jgi:hypothetical protein
MIASGATTTQKCRAIEHLEPQLRNSWCNAAALLPNEAAREIGAWLICRFSDAKSLTYFTLLSLPRPCLKRIALQYASTIRDPATTGLDE